MASEIIFPLPFIPTSEKKIYLGEDRKFGFLGIKSRHKKTAIKRSFCCAAELRMTDFARRGLG